MLRKETGRASWVFAVLLACAATGCGDGPPKPGVTGGASQPATAPLDYLAVQGKARQHAGGATSLAQVQQALRQFHASEDRWPGSLDELVRAGYLPKVPPLPAGQQIDYDPRTGSAKIRR